MEFNKYQNKSAETCAFPLELHDHQYYTIGLAGEVGEVCNEVKKIIRDDDIENDIEELSQERLEKVKDEMSDVLFYFSALATKFGFSLEEIAEHSLDKVKKKKEKLLARKSPKKSL